MNTSKYLTATPEYARLLLTYIPQRPDYQTWLYVISAIGNTFPEDVAISLLSEKFQDEKENETLHKLRKRLMNISFGTLVYLAQRSGFKRITLNGDSQQGAFSLNANITLDMPKKTLFADDLIEILSADEVPETSTHINRFLDYELEERAGILEFEANFTRKEAENVLLERYPFAETERVFRIAINSAVLNKNNNPKTNKPHKNFYELTREFKNYTCTPYEIALNIGKGNAIIPAHLTTDYNGNIHRMSSNFRCSELIAIDIDNKHEKENRALTQEEGYLSLEEALSLDLTSKALMIYTTPNHKSNWNRYRIIFALKKCRELADEYTETVNTLIHYYNADKHCTDPARAFYGNNNATIYMIKTGEVLTFSNGILQ